MTSFAQDLMAQRQRDAIIERLLAFPIAELMVDDVARRAAAIGLLCELKKDAKNIGRE